MTQSGQVGDAGGRVAVLFTAVALLVAGGVAGVAAGDDPGDGEPTISPAVSEGEGEQLVLVYFGTDRIGPAERADGVSVDQLQARADSAQAPLNRFAEATPGVTVRNNFWLGNVALVEIEHARVDVSELAAVDGVEHVGPNFEVTVETGSSVTPASTAPTNSPDTGMTAPAGVSLTQGTLSSHYTYGLEQINAPDVWSAYGTKGSGTTVTVLDTGVDPDHQDIDLSKWNEWDRDGNEVDSNPQDYDPDGHGTHVSGTVSGGDAGGTHIGVAPAVTLHHGAVLTQDCSNDCTGTLAQITAGMQWAVDNNADVLSMSLGAGDYVEQFIDPVRDAQSAGTLVVAASGNRGKGTSSSPGNVYDALSVGASDSNRNIASFSSGEVIDTDSAWGSDAPSDWPEQYIVPTVSAPGVGIESATPGGGYETKSGTSMAAPHVSAAAALVQAATSSDLSVSEIETALVETADHPDGDTQDNRYGHGIIDVKAAADYASGDLPANFEVTIDSTNSPIDEGETLTVDATVENTGDKSDTQTIRLDVPGLGQDSTDVNLGGGESTTVTLSVSTGSGDGDDYTATVDSDDDSDSTGVTVNAPANFAVAIDGTNEPVTEGETLSVDATVDNTGDKSDTQTITLTVGGQQRASTDVDLGGGESTTVTLTWDTSGGDAGDYTATVDSDDDSDSTGVTVQESANLAVSVDTTNSPIVAGETLSVEATVQNTGGATDTQSIALTVGGQQRASKSVELGGGESTTVTLTWDTSDGDAGDYTATVDSDDDSDSTGVTVQQPAEFSVAVAGTNSPVVEGETLSVDAEVQNAGESTDTQSVALTVDGQERNSTAVTLSGGETRTVTLRWETAAGDAGKYDATVESNDDSASTGVTINVPSILAVSVDSTNAPVLSGETLSVDATVENTGEESKTQTVALTVGGQQRNSTEVTLAGGESTTLTFEWATSEGDAGEYTATVASDDDDASAAVEVQVPPNLVVSLDGTNAPVVEGETLSFEATVENTGGATDTQSIALTIGGQQRASTEVTLADGESTTVTLTWDTSDGDAGEYTATIASDDDSASAGVTVHKPAEFGVEITDTSSPVVQNETLLVNATVENAGDLSDRQTVTLTIGGQQRNSTEVTLTGGDSTTVTLAWVTDGGDADEYDAVVASADADARAPVTVVEDESELGPPPVVGVDPPQDLDGDGLYRDLNGDGQLTVADVQIFFQQRDSDVVQDNVDAFDFRTDGALSIGDVQLLFQEFLEQS